MFERLDLYPVDPIMIGADYVAADLRSDKLNLTVGIYEDEHGRTPILSAVKQAERILVEEQETKSYLALTGDADYCSTLGREVLGLDLHDDNIVSAQTSGGAVALRVMADLLAQMPSKPTIWLQSPTYGNYVPILMAAGAKFEAVPYYDRVGRRLTFDQMLDGLRAAKPGDVFLMQGVCHNPTGADMSKDQVSVLLDFLEAKHVVPWIDLAYLGFARSFDEDSEVARLITARFPECIICVTLSKSFGIYRDRAGALFVKSTSKAKERVRRAISAIVRSGASHAPDHGPAVVKTILQRDDLKETWLHELSRMRDRVQSVRRSIVETEYTKFGSNTLAFMGNQSGMFSLLPITEDQETELTRQHGIHVVKGGRVNVARLGTEDIAKLIYAVRSVTGSGC